MQQAPFVTPKMDNLFEILETILEENPGDPEISYYVIQTTIGRPFRFPY